MARERRSAGLSQKNRIATWIGVGVTLFLLVSSFNWVPFLRPIIRKLELNAIDWRFEIRGPRPPGHEVVIVAIDEKSLAEVGHWPWARSRIAELVDRLATAKSKVIVFDVLFPEAEAPPEGLLALRQTIESQDSKTLSPTERTKLATLVDSVVRNTSGDDKLANAIRQAGNVVLACNGGTETSGTTGLSTPRDVLEKAEYGFVSGGENAKFNLQNYPPAAWDYVIAPIRSLAEASAGLGLINYVSSPDRFRTAYADQCDRDGVIRRIPLATRLGNDSSRLYMPLFLQTLRVYWGLAPHECRVTWGDQIRMGDKAQIDMSTWGDVFINWPYSGHSFGFETISASDVLAGKVAPGRLDGRIVLIAATAAGLYDLRVTPLDPSAPGVMAHASAIDTVLSGCPLTQPVSTEAIVLILAALVGLTFSYLLPRVSALVAVSVTLIATVSWLVVAQLLFLRGVLVPVVLPALMLFAVPGASISYKFITEQAEKFRIRDTFARYVSPKIVNRILADPEGLKLGGKRGEVTILFSDIRSFTAMSEKMDPEQVVSILNEYLTAMTEIVDRHEGTVDKFIGDAIMAVFGAPFAHPDDPLRAVQTALGMMEELKHLHEKWKSEGRPVFQIGIGINTGPVVVGNIGSPRKMDYTEIGDNVNLASRLESQNKEFGTSIILSQYTYEKVVDRVNVRRLGEVKVKGKETAVEIFELLSLRSGAAPA